MTDPQLLEEITAHLDVERNWLAIYEHLRDADHRIRGKYIPAEVSECDKLHAELHGGVA